MNRMKINRGVTKRTSKTNSENDSSWPNSLEVGVAKWAVGGGRGLIKWAYHK